MVKRRKSQAEAPAEPVAKPSRKAKAEKVKLVETRLSAAGSVVLEADSGAVIVFDSPDRALAAAGALEAEARRALNLAAAEH